MLGLGSDPAASPPAQEQAEKAERRQDDGDQQDDQHKNARDADRLLVSFLWRAHAPTVKETAGLRIQVGPGHIRPGLMTYSSGVSESGWSRNGRTIRDGTADRLKRTGVDVRSEPCRAGG